MYKATQNTAENSQPKQEHKGTSNGSSKEENVTDVDFEEVKDDKGKSKERNN